MAGSRSKFLDRRWQIFYFCCRGDLGHISQYLNLGFTAAAHKYSSLIAGGIWSGFAGIWTCVSQRMLTNVLFLLQGRFGACLPESGPSFHSRRSQIFYFCCRGDLERLCRNLDLVFTADAHKYSTFVAGAIWSAFAGIWTWVSQRKHWFPTSTGVASLSWSSSDTLPASPTQSSSMKRPPPHMRASRKKVRFSYVQ